MWLRSPGTNDDYLNAWLVRLDGDLVYYNNVIDYYYGRIYHDRLFQNSKILVVKIAEHALWWCIFSLLFWWRPQQRQLQCLVFLRTYSPGTITNLDAFIATTTGDVSPAGNTSIYTYSYGKLFKYL